MTCARQPCLAPQPKWLLFHTSSLDMDRAEHGSEKKIAHVEAQGLPDLPAAHEEERVQQLQEAQVVVQDRQRRERPRRAVRRAPGRPAPEEGWDVPPAVEPLLGPARGH